MTLSRRLEFAHGMRDTIPLLIGALPFGLLYGALAVNNGLSAAASMAMSAVVFAGSSQFVAVGLLGAHAPVLLIVGVTFIVNLRHLLYSAALLPYVSRLNHAWRVFLSFWLTDETFAVSAAHYAQAGAASGEAPGYLHYFQLGSSVSMYLNWQLWSGIGVILGTRIPDVGHWGLDLAMPVTFIGMVIPYVRNRAMVACVASSGAVALLTIHLPYHLGLLLAAFAGISAGIVLGRRLPKTGEAK